MGHEAGQIGRACTRENPNKPQAESARFELFFHRVQRSLGAVARVAIDLDGHFGRGIGFA
jgi:hypothetical protein